MTIRPALAPDENQIRRIYRAAFDERERDLVANLAGELLKETSTPETLHLVADLSGELVGHVAFSPVRSKTTKNLVGFILAPLGVDPGSQKMGIGSKLVRDGLQQLAGHDVGLVFVYGDPDDDGRFGFTTALAEEFIPPFELTYPSGWQAVDLGERKAVAGSETIECVKALSKPELW